MSTAHRARVESSTGIAAVNKSMWLGKWSAHPEIHTTLRPRADRGEGGNSFQPATEEISNSKRGFQSRS